MSAKSTIDANIQNKFTKTRAEMNEKLIEREDEIDVVLVSLVAGHHPLLVGDPGTAKSLLSRTLAGWMDGHDFEVLLNKFTDPAELFGPVDIGALKNNQYRRQVEGYLPTVRIAFLDEIFKGSTAIVNTTLGILNERTFRNGLQVLKCPLEMAIGASNEFPNDGEGGKELAALFDRFLFRKIVRPVASPDSERRLLFENDLTPKLSTRISPEEVQQARREANEMEFTEEAQEAVIEILHTLRADGIMPGDRRKRWSVGAARGYAYLTGATSVEKVHLEVLGHTLWVDPTEQPMRCQQICAKIANPLGLEVNERLGEAREIVTKMNINDLPSALEAGKKLKEIESRLAKLARESGAGVNTDKVLRAKEYVSKALSNVRAKLVEKQGI